MSAGVRLCNAARYEHAVHVTALPENRMLDRGPPVALSRSSLDRSAVKGTSRHTIRLDMAVTGRIVS